MITRVSGNSGFVDGEAHWQAISDLIDLYARAFPREFEDFLATNQWHRNNLKNEYGLIADTGKQVHQSSASGNTTNMRVTMTWPPKLMRLVRACFRLQPFDKKFNTEFVKRFPGFGIGKR